MPKCGRDCGGYWSGVYCFGHGGQPEGDDSQRHGSQCHGDQCDGSGQTAAGSGGQY